MTRVMHYVAPFRIFPYCGHGTTSAEVTIIPQYVTCKRCLRKMAARTKRHSQYVNPLDMDVELDRMRKERMR